MEIAVSRSELYKGLQKVLPAVPAKTTLPILTNILFRAEGDSVKLTGTDLEISVTTSIPAEVVEGGSVAVSARTLGDIVRELPDVGLHVACDERQRMTITTDRGTYTLLGQQAEDFPSVTGEEYENSFQIAASVFARLIEKSVFAVSSDVQRRVLTGVCFEVYPDELRLVATDGHRLSKVVYKQQNLSSGERISVIVPPRALLAASKAIGEGVTYFQIKVAPDQIMFSSDATEVYAKLIEGQYPNYEKVIPSDNDKILTVDKEEMTAALRRVAIFSSSTTRQVRLEMDQNNLTVSSEDVEVGGEGREVLSVEYEGEPLRIGYNASYLLEILRHIETNVARFELRDPMSAAVIRPSVQREDEDFLALVMPIRLTEE